MSLFHMRTGPISTKFCKYLHTNSEKVLSTSMTPPTLTLDPNSKTLADLGRKNFV